MSYQARGEGYILFSNKVEQKTFWGFLTGLTAHFEQLSGETSIREAGHPNYGCACIDVNCGPDQNYHGDDLAAVLKEIAKTAESIGSPIKEGEIDFVGEDDNIWRLVYRDGCWHEENGRTEYENISTREVIDAFVAYVNNDLAAAEPDYVREVLTDVCGLNSNQLKAIGLDYLFEEEDDDEEF